MWVVYPDKSFGEREGLSRWWWDRHWPGRVTLDGGNIAGMVGSRPYFFVAFFLPESFPSHAFAAAVSAAAATTAGWRAPGPGEGGVVGFGSVNGSPKDQVCCCLPQSAAVCCSLPLTSPCSLLLAACCLLLAACCLLRWQ